MTGRLTGGSVMAFTVAGNREPTSEYPGDRERQSVPPAARSTSPTKVKLVAGPGLWRKKPSPGGRDGGSAGVWPSALTHPPNPESYPTRTKLPPFQVRISSPSSIDMISLAPLVTPALNGFVSKL